MGSDLAYVSSVHAYETIRRYPMTSRARLREDLSTALFTLANYSSSVHATVALRLRRPDSNAKGRSSRERDIDETREKLLGDVFGLLLKLREDSAYTAWEPVIGGKFPRLQYNSILDQMQRCVLFMTFVSRCRPAVTDTIEITSLTAYVTLVSDGTHSFTEHLESKPSWIGELYPETFLPRAASWGVAKSLVILAACVNSGQPLPASFAPDKIGLPRNKAAEIDKAMTNIPPLDPRQNPFSNAIPLIILL